MREISSEEYAEYVEDVICTSLEDALMGAFEYIAKHFGCIEDYDERITASRNMSWAFQEGCEATWRDQAIELFELYGLDVRPDEREW